MHRNRASHGLPYEKRADGKGKAECIEDEIPFDLPEGWSWARFGSYLVNRDSERIPVSVATRNKLEKTYDYYLSLIHIYMAQRVTVLPSAAASPVPFAVRFAS